MRVLFICHNENSFEQIAYALRIRWPDLTTYTAGPDSEFLKLLTRYEPDMMFLCKDLHDGSIWPVVGEIRKFSDVPVVLSMEGADDMKEIKAIEMGADAYINTPCSLMIIVARILAIMRRIGLPADKLEERPIICGGLVINPNTFETYLRNNRIDLTPVEFRLLYLLAKNRQQTLSQNFIQDALWNHGISPSFSMKKYIQRIRQKLGDDARNPTWIKTVRGVGYRFSASD